MTTPKVVVEKPEDFRGRVTRRLRQLSANETIESETTLSFASQGDADAILPIVLHPKARAAAVVGAVSEPMDEEKAFLEQVVNS